MPGSEELILAKAAALLHDPPHKAWIVLGKYRVGASASEGREAHELEALRLAEELLKDTVLEGAVRMLRKADRRVHEADVLASSIDRILTPPKSAASGVWGALHIANMFDPKSKYRLRSEVPRDAVNKFVSELGKVLRSTGDPILAYHALQALLEPMWFKLVGDEFIGPADTRVPNHTIFDHLHATATAVNMTFSKGGPRGYFILLDLAGIQAFVARARKTADYWAGSWLVSAMAWYLVREVVERFGPDVLVLPTARMNPFYVCWLLGKARRRRCDSLVNAINEFLNEMVGEGWPRNPVIPGTITLVIPDEAVQHLMAGGGDVKNAIKQYFVKRLMECWGLVVDAVAEALPNDLEEVRKALHAVREHPPLLLRVGVIDVREACEELKSALGEANVRPLLYHHIVSKAFGRLTGSVASNVGVFADWEELIKGRMYRLCSMCDSLPAVVALSRKGCLTYSTPSKEDVLVPIDSRSLCRELISAASLKEGEALCPYCLVKRMLSNSDVLRRVVEALVGEGVSVSTAPTFPSTADLANVWCKLELMRRVGLWSRAGFLRKAIDELTKLVGRPPTSYKRGEVIGVLREELNRVEAECGSRSSEYLFALAVVLGEAEEYLLTSGRNLLTVLRDEALKHWKGLVKNVEDLKTLRYYAIIAADADNIGDVLSGRKWFMKPPEGGGRAEAIASYYREVLGEAASGADEAIANVAKRIDEVVRRYEGMLQGLSVRGGSVFMPVTLTYHSCISRALMATAIRDSKVVGRYGVVVYAGGDDLMALTPVVTVDYVGSEARRVLVPLYVTRSTRECFWGIDGNGFIRLAGLSPALRATGRSYSIAIMHYKDPMSAGIGLCRDGLEDVAKHAEVVSAGSGPQPTKLVKDSTYITYCRGGSEGVALPNVVPGNTSLCEALGAVARLEGLMDNRRLSENIARDIEDNRALLEMLSRISLEDALAMLKYIIKRNASGKESERIPTEVTQALSKAGLHTCRMRLEVDGRVTGCWLPLLVFEALKLIRGGERR